MLALIRVSISPTTFPLRPMSYSRLPTPGNHFLKLDPDWRGPAEAPFLPGGEPEIAKDIVAESNAFRLGIETRAQRDYHVRPGNVPSAYFGNKLSPSSRCSAPG